MSGWQGPPVLVGERTLWLGSGSGLPKSGVIRWIGRIPEIGPDWTVGLELDEALPVGGIDGTWGGRVLFSCRSRHGLLVPISSIIPGSQLKLIPNFSGFEKKQDAVDLCPTVPWRQPKPKKSLPPSEVLPVVAGPKETPKPAARQKRRIPTPPSTESDESSGNVPHKTVTDQATLRVEERTDQEDSLKKRLRLFTESHGQARRMEATCNDDVIEALYARRQQFARHGRSQSDSANAFISSASSSGSRRERSAIFSIFRWFRKDSRSEEFDEFAPSAPPSPELIRSYSSRCGSVDTLFSTATANSFAFVSPALYRPFGAANPPEKHILSGPETDTYRNRLRQRDKIREQDKNLTLKKKYHLFGSDTLHRSADDVRTGRHFFINKSLDSFKAIDVSSGSKNSTLNRKKRKAPPPPLDEEKPKEFSLPNTFEHNKEITETPDNLLVKPRHRRTVSDSAKDRKSGAFVHVKGKRKAPPPPIIDTTNNQQTDNREISGTQSLGRKKRPAPLPPLEFKNQENSDDSSGSPGFLSPGEKQRLIENIAKLKAHADRKSLLLTTPPASPTLDDKMPHTVCNDSLKLERGVLKANKAEVQSPESKPSTPTPVSPRPWYKRNNINKEKSLEKRKDKKKIDDWMPEVSIVRGNLINPEVNNTTVTNAVSNGNGNINSGSNNSANHRFSNIFSRFDKPEEKRKSQISMLANISELDREAAEIVQRGQDKEKAILAAHDAKFYNTVELPTQSPIKQPEVEIIPLHEPTTGSPETSKKSGARELISLFNAIGNVTKVTINSAFVSKDGPSIFTKEGIEKRFSMTDGSVKTSEEKVIKESVSQENGYKRETVIIETKETYLESPGIKRRRGLYHQDSGSSTSSDTATPKVVIEEIEEFDGDKSKTQALYEANKVRKHLTPDPSIPTIAEMSESMSSVTTSPGSTLNPSERSISVTPTPPAIKEESASLSTTVSTSITTASSVLAQSTKNYSIWTCPRCTLENPRWRVTCEACDMWRPAVRKDVIDKLTNTNMGTTIAVNIVKASEPKSTAVAKTTTSLVETKITPSATKTNDVSTNKAKEPTKKLLSSGASALLTNSKIERPITKPITVSSLLSGEGFNGESKIVEKKEIETRKSNYLVPTAGSAPKSSSVTASSSSAIAPSTSTNKPSGAIQKEIKTKDKLSSNNMPSLESVQSNATTENDKDMEDIRKARLAFFLKSQPNDKTESSEQNKEEMDREASKTRSSINQAKIDALFSIASKGSLATNEEERLKVKEILKEMKNSLPKKTKEKTNAGSSRTDNKVNITKDSLPGSLSTSNDEARLGAIKKTTGQTSISAPSSATKYTADVRQKDEKKAEVYLIKSETIIEEIKVKDNSKSPKVSTSVQTNGVVRKIEPKLPVTKDAAKPLNGKPPTPKVTKKEIIVPVTVEEHVTGGSVQTTFTKEQRKMGIRAFELIRPRDFINIEATKTGNEVKPLHTYANIATTHNDDSSGSSSSSESPEISRLTAQLSKPKGLADFKAAVLEGAAGNKMDTLAVNRLLRQLEGAIAGGQHQRAATLAKQLAKHKVNCCVTRHKHTDTIQVDMFVEDKLSHQGPFPVQVSPTMTVAQLKAKVEREFEIPATVQRWILGKTLATGDSITLAEMGVDKPHSPMFLYLVAPDLSQDKTAPLAESTKNEAPKINVSPALATVEEATNGAAALAPPPGRGWYYNQQDDRYSYCESETTDHSSKDPSPDRVEPQTAQTTVASNVVVEEVETEEEEDEAVEEVEEMIVDTVTAAADRIETPPTVLTGTLTIGWKCTVCTLVNAPTRPGCLACAADRPAGYEATGTEQTAQTEAVGKLKNYQDLMTLESADLIPSTESFECSVCLTDCAAGDGIVLRDCLHTFCRACLAHTVQFTDEAEVKCPFRDHNYACDSTLQEREIKALVSAEVYEQHLAKSVAQAENKIGNAFHCKKPDCPGWCIFEDNVNIFQCPVCNQSNCLTCQAIHEGMDCKQYQEQAQEEAETNADARRTREMLEEMVQRGEALPCPTCKVVLMKKWGCDWLRCSMCKTEICWVTRGPRWGPNGKGDSSGGCKCGVNGVKCHPKCNYCH